MKPFTIEEVKKVVLSLVVDQAPSPDGFTTFFFQKCWDVLGSDHLTAIEESRKSKMVLKNFNVTNIVILPKVKEPKIFADFRPISLFNTIYKIITKAICLRLQHLIPKFISPKQGGFVPGKETVEGALIAHEVLHSINTSHLPSFIAKIDMMKAYDKVK